MNWIGFLRLANLFVVGMIAGMEFAIHRGLSRYTAVLNNASQIRLRQVLILRSRIVVPAIFIPAAATGILIVVFDRHASGIWLRIGGMLAVLTWVVIRVLASASINSSVLGWKPANPPDGWRALVSRAERFRITALCAAVMAFVFFAVATGFLPPFR